MFKCHICGKECKTQFALDGHYRLGDDQHHAYYLSTRKPMMAVAPRESQPYNDPYQTPQPPQPAKQSIKQSELWKEQADCQEQALRMDRIAREKENDQREDHNRFMERYKPNNQQQQQKEDPRIETMQKEIDMLKKQNVDSAPKKTIDAAPSDAPTVEPIPGTLNWIRREDDMQNQINIDRTNDNLKRHEHDKRIRELEEKLEEKDRKYKKMEEKAIEFSEYKYSPETAWGDEDEDDDEADEAND